MEANITSDLDFYINTHQVEFIKELSDEHVAQIGKLQKWKVVGVPESLPNTSLSNSNLCLHTSTTEGAADSGIVSMLSSQQEVRQDFSSRGFSVSDFDYVHIPLKKSDSRPEETEAAVKKAFVSFDLLLTAGRISLHAYTISKCDNDTPYEEPSLAKLPTKKGELERKHSNDNLLFHTPEKLPIMLSADSVLTGGARFRQEDASTKPRSISTASLIGEDVFEHASALVSHLHEDVHHLASSSTTVNTVEPAFIAVEDEEEEERDETDEDTSSFHSPAKSVETESTASSRLAAEKEQLLPFLYILFSQPHTYILCKPSRQKIEASCYDVVVRGGKGRIELSGNKYLCILTY